MSKAGARIRCINEGCDYAADPEATEPAPAEGAPPPESAPPAPDTSGGTTT